MQCLNQLSPLGLAVIPIFLLVGVAPPSVVRYQIEHGAVHRPVHVTGEIRDGKWLFAIPYVIRFLRSTIGSPRTNRLPFLYLPRPNRSSPAVTTPKYSSMKFASDLVKDAAMISGSAVIVTLFFGGWHFPGIPDGSHGWIFGLINIAVFFTKVAIIIFVFMWVRWTLPRFRYDQLMRLGWLFFFEIALVNIFVVAGIMALLPD